MAESRLKLRWCRCRWRWCVVEAEGGGVTGCAIPGTAWPSRSRLGCRWWRWAHDEDGLEWTRTGESSVWLRELAMDSSLAMAAGHLCLADSSKRRRRRLNAEALAVRTARRKLRATTPNPGRVRRVEHHGPCG
uniref:Uncharacterized protein n=1 Tax=Ixodes ricinus TaxID=34613 RepID=A0A6B0US79_IXORI